MPDNTTIHQSGDRSSGSSRILVIGAGFIGGAAIEALTRSGLKVTVVLRSVGINPSPRLQGARTYYLQALTHDSIVECIQAHDHVLLAAGGASPVCAEGRATEALHTELDLLNAILTANRGRRRPLGVTYLSSGGAVYGDAPLLPTPEHCPTAPISDYGYAKLAGEELLQIGHAEDGLRARILRIGNAYGPGQPTAGLQGVVGAALRAAITNEPMMLVDGGRNIRDFVFIDDIVSVIVKTIQLGENLSVLNVGSGVGTSIRELMRIIEATTGLQLLTQDCEPRPFDVRASVLAVDELRRRMPFEPTSLVAGIAATWAATCARLACV